MLGRIHLAVSRAAQWRTIVASLVLTDLALIGISFRVAYWIRFELQLSIFKLEIVPNLAYYQRFSLYVIPVWLLVFALFGLYSRDNLLGGTKEYDLLFRAITFMLFMITGAGFLEVFLLSRGWLMVAWLTTLVSVMVGRFTARRFIYALRERGFFLTPALIIGANDEGRLLGEQLSRWRRSGLYPVGFVDEDREPGTQVFEDLHVLGSLDSLGAIIRRFRVGELILATSALDREEMLRVFRSHGISKDVNLRMSSGLFEIITTGLQVRELAYVPLVRVDKVRLTGVDEIFKLLLDWGLTIPLLVLLSPFLLAIAIAVRLDSPGPVIHRRRVMGLNGSEFDALKFRTMYVDGDARLSARPDLQTELARNHKLKTDPRVTRVGRFLRRFSIDELPQLFNVLFRQMSLVGPRMISPPEMAEYDHWGINLLTVRPGITGLWQVSGRSNLTYEKRVRLDMYYIRNWTIWLDLYILMQTVPVVLRGTGAY